MPVVPFATCTSCTTPETLLAVPRGFERQGSASDQQARGNILARQIAQLEQNVLQHLHNSISRLESLMQDQEQRITCQISMQKAREPEIILSGREQVSKPVPSPCCVEIDDADTKGKLDFRSGNTDFSVSGTAIFDSGAMSPVQQNSPSWPHLRDATALVETSVVLQDRGSVLKQRGDDVHAYRQAMGWHNGNVKHQRSTMMKSCIEVWVDSVAWNVCCGIVVVTNAIVVGWEAHQRATTALQKALHRSGQGSPCTSNVHKHFFSFCDIVFAIWLSVEITLGVLAERSSFLTGHSKYWNMFDLVMWVSAVFTAIMEAINLHVDFNVTFLRATRLMRIVKMARVARLFRYLNFKTGLRKMLISIGGSMIPLLWAMFLMFLFMYGLGVVILQTMTSYAEDIHAQNGSVSGNTSIVADNSGTVRRLDGFAFDLDLDDTGAMSNLQAIYTLYGTLPRTLVTLFWSISGGDWGLLALPLTKISEAFVYLYVIYICFIFFGVTNVLIGIFCDNALQAAHADKQSAIQEHLNEEQGFASKIRAIFIQADTDHSGTMTLEEFANHCDNPEFCAYLSSLGIQVTEAKGLFSLMDTDQSNEVEIEEFITGCLRVHGTAKAVDVATLLYENKKMATKTNRFMHFVHNKLEEQSGLIRSYYKK